ncbi:Clp protease ClpP [Streptomyces sp. PSKA54]|uniref:ATP-dependent Clp protease proteolytic subunit n=1 Tax=Streptomyces himalayensis subsp. aureolus TaxID=2758039 RepID=A0A7W2HJB7_9ACTN|nr:head maturation protease, ClpP-related [Streptomyces himalayensis]MBA4865918.1 Clp protease ClpP [Streptomyces himalayensis subsp. aureolus]
MSRMPGLALPANLTSFVARQREKADKLRAEHGIEPQSWYRITNAASPDEAEVMLYDEVGGWYGATADQFIADLRGVTSPNLRVRINSPGGSVFEGIAIANALRSHPANVTIQVDGIAASIASVIAMAGDRIEMAPNTMLMIHDASGVCLGNASDMEEMAELLDLISDNIADAYAARAGGTRDEWRARMRSETWYLPEDAVEAGLADEATSTPRQGEPAAPDEDAEPDMLRAWDLAAYGYQGPRQPEPQSEPVTLTFNLGESFGQELADMLRKTVARRPDDTAAAVEDTTPVEPAPVAEAPAPEPAEEPPAEPEAEPETPNDSWAADTAHLIEPADDWAADVAHFINPQASSSAATAAA